jgi:hypothetical protein
LGELIVETIEPETWDRDGIGEISEAFGIVTVKHTAQSHRRIERLLQLLDGAP